MSERLSPEIQSFQEKTGAIHEQLRQDIELVRELSREQVDIWKRVPYWALMSEGRDGYVGRRQTAYKDGLWSVGSAQLGYYEMAVDLDNGELVRVRNPQELSSDSAMLRLIAGGLEQLNAQSVLERLTEEAVMPVSPYASRTPEELAAWHREQMEVYNVSEYYVRERQISAEEMSERMAIGLGKDLA